MDKRKHTRLQIQFRSTFSEKNQIVAGDGELRDLSPGGCRIISPMAVSVGAEFEVCVFTGEDSIPLVIDGTSVHWVRNQEFGLEFTKIRPEVQRRLTQLCRRLGLYS